MQKRGLLYELKDGYRIDMTEEEYREKREELGQIAARLHVNLDVLDLLENDYRMRKNYGQGAAGSSLFGTERRCE